MLFDIVHLCTFLYIIIPGEDPCKLDLPNGETWQLKCGEICHSGGKWDDDMAGLCDRDGKCVFKEPSLDHSHTELIKKRNQLGCGKITYSLHIWIF